MQKRYGQLGERFVKLGLISQADVERALARQAEVGGYFGDALVELGLLKREQVHWGLADQYDVPFVRMRPEHIDHALARRVPAVWAREHLILPVLRDGDTVTAVLAGPAGDERLDEVRRFTGAARVEPALSTEATLRELIDAVYGVGNGQPVALAAWLRTAIDGGAVRFGVSVRGERAQAWAGSPGRARVALLGDWPKALREAVAPFPAPDATGVARWPAVLCVGGAAWCVDCRRVGGARSFEWVAERGARLPARYPHLDADARLRAAALAAHGGTPRLLDVVAADDAGAAVLAALLPTLPLSVGEGELRALHLSDRPAAVPDAVTALVVAPSDAAALAAALAALEGFGLDALTLDVERIAPDALDAARRAAPLVAVHQRAAAGALSADVVVRLAPAGETLIWTALSPDDATD